MLSSMKKGFPRLTSSRLRGSSAGSSPRRALEQLARTLGRQRVEPQLAVVGLAAPAMLVLGPVVDEQEEPRRRQALDETVQQGLRLGIDPVQVLDDQTQGLRDARGQDHLPEGLVRPLAPQRRIDRAERVVGRQHPQQVEQGRQEPIRIAGPGRQGSRDSSRTSAAVSVSWTRQKLLSASTRGK